jgi:hypothetical protein
MITCQIRTKVAHSTGQEVATDGQLTAQTGRLLAADDFLRVTSAQNSYMENRPLKTLLARRMSRIFFIVFPSTRGHSKCKPMSKINSALAHGNEFEVYLQFSTKKLTH